MQNFRIFSVKNDSDHVKKSLRKIANYTRTTLINLFFGMVYELYSTSETYVEYKSLVGRKIPAQVPAIFYLASAIGLCCDTEQYSQSGAPAAWT